MKTFYLVVVLLGVFGRNCHSQNTNESKAPVKIPKSHRPYCGPNAHYLSEGPPCDTACDSVMEQCNINNILPASGCYCLPGYARDAKNNCIPISVCSSQVGTCCGKYEIFYASGKAPSNCQITCETLNQECNIVNIVAASGCYCIPGYARGDSGVCIPQSQCNLNLS